MLCKTDTDLIWIYWSGFGQTHLVWKQAGVQELSGPVSGRTQPARYQFSTFRLGSILPQTSRTPPPPPHTHTHTKHKKLSTFQVRYPLNPSLSGRDIGFIIIIIFFVPGTPGKVCVMRELCTPFPDSINQHFGRSVWLPANLMGRGAMPS